MVETVTFAPFGTTVSLPFAFGSDDMNATKLRGGLGAARTEPTVDNEFDREPPAATVPMPSRRPRVAPRVRAAAVSPEALRATATAAEVTDDPQANVETLKLDDAELAEVLQTVANSLPQPEASAAETLIETPVVTAATEPIAETAVAVPLEATVASPAAVPETPAAPSGLRLSRVAWALAGITVLGLAAAGWLMMSPMMLAAVLLVGLFCLQGVARVWQGLANAAAATRLRALAATLLVLTVCVGLLVTIGLPVQVVLVPSVVVGLVLFCWLNYLKRLSAASAGGANFGTPWC